MIQLFTSEVRLMLLKEAHETLGLVSVTNVKQSAEGYRQITNISSTISQNVNVSRLVLQLSLHNSLKPGVKSKMKMLLEQRRLVKLQLHMSDQQI